MKISSSPQLTKLHPIHKFRSTRSSRKLTTRSHLLTNNFHRLLRTVAQPLHPRPTNQLISFLNFRKKKEEPEIGYIPSIENMLSEQNIPYEDQGMSRSQIQHGFSEEIVSETSYEMRVLYLCLLEKIMKQLQHHTSASQRRKIIRGAWNILTKYCKDYGCLIFRNIGTRIEWGLLELINFDFNCSPREKYNAERLLRSSVPENQNDFHTCA